MPRLFYFSLAIGILSILTLGSVLVRVVVAKLNPPPSAPLKPQRVGWASPTMVITTLALVGLAAAALAVFFSFWVACARGPDLC
jgi:hypothetical protein